MADIVRYNCRSWAITKHSPNRYARCKLFTLWESAQFERTWLLPPIYVRLCLFSLTITGRIDEALAANSHALHQSRPSLYGIPSIGNRWREPTENIVIWIFINNNFAAIQSVSVFKFIIFDCPRDSRKLYGISSHCGAHTCDHFESIVSCITYRRTYLIVPQVYKSTYVLSCGTILLLAATDSTERWTHCCFYSESVSQSVGVPVILFLLLLPLCWRRLLVCFVCSFFLSFCLPLFSHSLHYSTVLHVIKL